MTVVHHSAVCVRDLDASLRFYRDGLGLAVLMDHEFEGPWGELLDAPRDKLRSVFLGDPATPDAGIVELVAFDGSLGSAVTPGPPRPGFFLLSFFVDVEATLARVRALGFGGEVRLVEVPGPSGSVRMATVRDPDGGVVELVGASPKVG